MTGTNVARRFWLGFVLCGLVTQAQAYSLTAIHDYRPLVSDPATGFSDEQKQFPALVYEFEGLSFTSDGSLWAAISANPNGASRELWRLDLASGTRTALPHPGSVSVQLPPPFGTVNVPLQMAGNPVGLASIGEQLVVGHNFQQYGNLIGSVDVVAQTWSPLFTLGTNVCDRLQGLAYGGGKLFAACQNDGRVLELDPATGTVSRRFQFGEQVLGLTETDDGRLIVGAYPSRKLIIFDPDGQRASETISIDDLFVDPDNAQPADWSDYHRLTGMPYAVQVTSSELSRSRPDPDGLAYRNGRIYMSFDGDLRIFEISAAAASVPEPGGASLLAFALAAVGWLQHRRNRASGRAFLGASEGRPVGSRQG